MTPELLQRIKTDDPGGDLDTAYAQLAVMTEVVPLDSLPVTIRMVAARYGLTAAEGIRQAIVAGFPGWVHDAFVGDGLDVVNPNTQAAITETYFSATQIDQLLAFASETRLKYPGLLPGHVLEARAL